jgi:hypothetical protein
VNYEDPFSNENVADREKYFQSTWGGKLSSGSIDLVGNIVVDPLNVIGTLGKATKLKSITVPEAEAAEALRLNGAGQAKAVAPTKVEPKVAPQATVEQAPEAPGMKMSSYGTPMTPPVTTKLSPTAENPAGVDQAADAEEQIRDAYHFLKPSENDFVRLARVREALPWIPKAQLDGALRKIAQEDDVNILADADQRRLSQGDKDSAVKIGDEDKHLIRVAEDEDPRYLTTRQKTWLDNSPSAPSRAVAAVAPTSPPTPAVSPLTVQPAPSPAQTMTKSASKVSNLLDRIAKASPAEMQRMPELASAPDVSALVVLFGKAKADNPKDFKAQKAAMADVLGAAWGDKASLDNLIKRRDELATQMENLTTPPKMNLFADQFTWEDGGQGAFTLLEDAGQREINARRAEIQAHIDKINDVRITAGQMKTPRRVGATLPENLKADALGRSLEGLDKPRPSIPEGTDLDLVDPDAIAQAHEEWLTQGLGSSAVRVVRNQAARRLPQHVNVQDTNEGFEQLSQYLAAMKYTPSEVKKSIADAFVKAPTVGARMQVIERLRKRIVQDIGARYGFDKATVQELINAGETRLSYTESSLKTRLYAALNGEDPNSAGFVSFDDAEDGIIHAFETPRLQSQLENHMTVLEPRLVEKEFQTLAGQRFMQRADIRNGRFYHGGGLRQRRLPDDIPQKPTAPDKAVDPATVQFQNESTGKRLGTSQGFIEATDNLRDVMDSAITRFTKIWKFAALARGAYGPRVQMDSQFRQMAHMETMMFMATRWHATKGVSKWLLSSKENDTISLRNLFKEGDYEKSLRDMFTKDLGFGSDWNINATEVNAILDMVLEKNGGVADFAGEMTDRLLKKKRTGDFGITRPQDSKNWLPDYTRVVSRQIMNSPSAMRLMENGGNVQRTADEIQRQSVKGGPMWDEYRKVGMGFGDPRDYLHEVSGIVSYYLPHQDMQAAVVKVGRKAEAAGDEGIYALHPPTVKSWFNPESGLAKPMDVHGEGYSLEHQAADAAAFDRMRGKIFEFIGTMPENIAARAPMFMYHYRDNVFRAIDNLGDEGIELVGIDNIRRNAMRQARKDMAKVLFDTTDLSNLSHSMRYLSPFFGAWEDTMKKWGMLMYENPGILSRVNQLVQAPNDFGMVPNTNHALVVDDNGNRVDSNGDVFDSNGNKITDKDYKSGGQYIFLPKSLTKHIPGSLGQGGIKIRKDSVNSIFQGEPWWLPGFGPMVQVPVNKLVRDSFPTEADDPIMKYVLPYGTTSDSAVTQLLPKWVKTAKNAFGNTQDFSNQYQIFLSEATIDERNGGPKVDLDKIHNKTRNYFILKAGLDNVSPVSIKPDTKYQFYIDKAHEYRSDPKRADWEAEYFKDFPGFGEMSIALSTKNKGNLASN